MLLHATFDAAALRDAVERAEATAARRTRGRCGRAATTTTTGSRRAGRATIRRATRAALVMLMGLRGTPFLYYGDEIGMIDTDVPDGSHPRSGRRVPRRAHGPRRRAHADAVDGASRARGSPTPGVEPWLPYGDFRRTTSPTSATIPIDTRDLRPGPVRARVRNPARLRAVSVHRVLGRARPRRGPWTQCAGSPGIPPQPCCCATARSTSSATTPPMRESTSFESVYAMRSSQ